jgi:ABC-2 type transport system permease protein
LSPPSQAAALPLRDVEGPTVIDRDWRRFGRLIWLMAKTDFKLRYEGSRLGLVWAVGTPLLFFGVLYLVFTLLRVNVQMKYFPVFLLFNIMMVQVFISATSSSVRSIVSRENLVRKTHFPRMTIPLASIITSSITLVIGLVIVFIYMLIYGVPPMWTWALLPVLIVPFVIFMLGMSMLLSSIYVGFRDIAHVWPVIARVLFYASVALYPIEKIASESARYVLVLNPIAAILVQARVWLLDPAAPSLLDVTHGWVGLLGPLAVFLTLCALGVWNFVRVAPRVAERL